MSDTIFTISLSLAMKHAIGQTGNMIAQLIENVVSDDNRYSTIKDSIQIKNSFRKTMADQVFPEFFFFPSGLLFI